MNWKPGDKAVCISCAWPDVSPIDGCSCPFEAPQIGTTYLVVDTEPCGRQTGLELSAFPGYLWQQSAFRKVVLASEESQAKCATNLIETVR